MSLINKLLNDLESRQSCLQDNQDMVLDGLYSAYDIEIDESNSQNRALFYVVIGLVMIVTILFHWFYTTESVEFFETTGANVIENSKIVVPAESDVAVLNDKPDQSISQETDWSLYSLKVDESLGKPPVSSSKENIVDDDPSRIRRIDINPEGNTIILSLEMAEKVDYRAYTLESPNRMVVEINDVKYEGGLPRIESLPGISNIRKRIDKNNNFIFVIESRYPMSILESGYLESDNNHELKITLANQEKINVSTVAGNNVRVQAEDKDNTTNARNSGETVTSGDLVKTLNKPPEISRTDKLLFESQELYKKGQVTQSLDLLYTVVNEDEGHLKARITLSLKLIEQDQRDLAISLLEDGLKKFPEQTEWSKLLAHIYLDSGNYDLSEEILGRTMPSISDDPEYHALYAATLQKLSKHESAALTYRDLVQIQPDNGIWWMGLAISLEAISRNRDAMYAYRNALNGLSLTPDTHRFIIERIRYLDSQIKNESS